MGRPLKQGLDFFSISTNFFHNRKIQRLIRAKGLDAATVFIATLCKIYAGNGYYAEIDENLFLDVGVLTGSDESRVAEVIQFCIDLELFDKKSASINNILTSYSIQKQKMYAHRLTRHRIDPLFAVDEWMQHGMPLFEETVSTAITPVSTAITPVTTTETPVATTKTRVSTVATPVMVAKTPVSAAKSAHTNCSNTDSIYLNNLKLKEKETDEKKTSTNRYISRKSTTKGPYEKSKQSTDDARWAELTRLAAEATGSRRDD